MRVLDNMAVRVAERLEAKGWKLLASEPGSTGPDLVIRRRGKRYGVVLKSTSEGRGHRVICCCPKPGWRLEHMPFSRVGLAGALRTNGRMIDPTLTKLRRYELHVSHRKDGLQSAADDFAFVHYFSVVHGT